jgi:hypothetical protein
MLRSFIVRTLRQILQADEVGDICSFLEEYEKLILGFRRREQSSDSLDVGPLSRNAPIICREKSVFSIDDCAAHYKHGAHFWK